MQRLTGQAAAVAMHKKRHVKRAGCANGLYLSPVANATISSLQPMTIQWDNTCFTSNPKSVDIYLTAPYNANPQIHTWYGVPYSSMGYNVTLEPKWWNSTDSVNLRLNIVESGVPSFLTQFPSGPIFTAKYDPSVAATNTAAAAAANTAIHDSPYTVVEDFFKGKGLTRGQIAAAILMPLLVVLVGIGVYVKITRMKEAKKRAAWNKSVDKRMSTISADWKSMTGAGASHAIRHSIAAGDRTTRASSFFAGSGPLGRPSSQYDHTSRFNGVGLAGAETDDPPHIRRPADVMSNPSSRVSRVSFAVDVHPRASMAGDSNRASIYTDGTRASRSYHRSFYATDEEPVPPIPELSPTLMSPSQAQGPQMLSPGEIRSKIAAAAGDEGRPSVDEGLLKLPAMSLMRTGEGSNDLVLPPPAPIEYPALPSGTSPSPSASTVSTSAGMKPTHESPVNDMTPDAMLKAYATKKKSIVVPPARAPRSSNPVVGFVKRRNNSDEKHGAETTSSANGGMRVLYAPQAPTEDSYESAYDEDSFYSGIALTANTTNGHTYTDSLAASTEEGVITYGHRTTVVLSPPTNASPVEIIDNNPFRKSMKVLSTAYSDISRYSTNIGEAS